MDGRNSTVVAEVNSLSLPLPPPRPYRSKRHRPCDVCRRRKHACYVDQQPPCRNCRELRAGCTFNDPPSKRRRPGPRHEQRPDRGRGREPDQEQEYEQELEQDQYQYQDQEHEHSRSHTQLRTSIPPLPVPLPVSLLLPCPAADTEPPRLHQPDSATRSGLGDLLLTDVEDARSHMLHPAHDDLWHLASLWDSTFTTSFEVDTALEDAEFGASYTYPQENPLGGLSVQDPEQPTTQPLQPDIALSNVPARAQPLRSLDILDKGTSVQYLGYTGAVDPFLLRYMRFSDDGVFDFGHFQYRRVAGRLAADSFFSSTEQIPAHFVVTGPKQDENIDLTLTKDRESKQTLETLVNCDLQARLIGLFLRYVFPGLPVLSRSQLKICATALMPQDRSLSTVPFYLLAAVCASAEPFSRYDPVLCVSQLNSADNTSALWDIAYMGIQQNMLKPQLAVLQAILIYLQRPSARSESAVEDLPGNRPLLGSAVHIAYQLGLHMDCQTWTIPPWERRLRRRLWWVLYSEVTWRSLLLGYPNTIPVDEWNVSPLEDPDFTIDHLHFPTEQSALGDPLLQEPCQFCHGGYDFRFLASLSNHASNVHRNMYTLAATKSFSNNFRASVETGQRLLANVRSWEKDLPAHMVVEGQPNNSKGRDYFHPGSATNIKLAFVTVEVLIYKAMLRPLPSIVISRNNPRPAASQNCADIRPSMEDSGYPDSELTTILETYGDAINLVRRASKFAHRLGSYDRNSLFYSWARNCFAIISNFILLLLVQAPTAELAKEVLALLSRWVMMLREQCIVFDHMQLGLLQLDRVFQLGIEKALCFPLHVTETVQAELPLPKYK